MSSRLLISAMPWTHQNQHGKLGVQIYVATLKQKEFVYNNISRPLYNLNKNVANPQLSWYSYHPVESRLLRDEKEVDSSKWYWMIMYGYYTRSSWKPTFFISSLSSLGTTTPIMGSSSNSDIMRSPASDVSVVYSWCQVHNATQVLQVLMQTLLPPHLPACGDPSQAFQMISNMLAGWKSFFHAAG